MRAELVGRFAASAQITAISTNPAAWDERPRSEAMPKITLTEVAPGINYLLDGPDGLEFAWVQFDLWAEDQVILTALEKALRAEMEAPRTDVGGVRFHTGFLESRRSNAPEDLPGGVKCFRRSIDYRFYWENIT